MILSDSFKSMFLSNLKTTFKFVGTVYVILSVKIVLDSWRDDRSDIYFPLHVLVYLPLIVISVYLYTRLKESKIHFLLCSLLFGVLVTAGVFVTYVLSSYFENSDINLKFINFMSLIFFVSFSLLYIQLPWKRDA